jgi:hypothetical protein
MRTALLIAALCVAGCATDEHAEERRDASRWDELAHGLAAVTADYCAAQPWAQPSCVEVSVQHAAAARPLVDEVRAMAPRMDDAVAIASRELADSVCTWDALVAELDRHAAAACGGPVADAEAEARRHCATVLDLTAQMHLRSDIALQPMTTTYYSGSGSMGGVPHQTSAASHGWPWPAGEQPTIVELCASAP